LRRLRPRISVELVFEDKVVVDETTGKLLLLIDKCGSILCAARSLGLAYSRAWERISRVEKLLGEKIVEVQRGGRRGGGARLTDRGKELLAVFLEAYRRVHGEPPSLPAQQALPGGSVVVYAGSHDVALSHLVGLARDVNVLVETHWIGSVRGLAALVLGEADLAGLHVYDPASGEYNIGLVRSLAKGLDIVLVKGYQRLQGFITRRSMELDELVKGLLEGRLTLINREQGSGTRILLEYFLKKWAEEHGARFDPSRVKGWTREARTHVEVAEAVARGEADVGLGIQCVAEAYGLRFVPVAWERFDVATTRQALGRDGVRLFLEKLCSEEFKKVLQSLWGYRVPEDFCEEIEP
jgi:putative molybdopterin biosynthesis protein